MELNFHRFLQYKALIWCYNHGCKYFAIEVRNRLAWFDKLPDHLKQYTTKKYLHRREIYDVIAIKDKEILGIEVKTSISDLKKGFCIGGVNRVYLLIPEELLDRLPKIPKEVGVLLYNRENDEVRCYRGAKYMKTLANKDDFFESIKEKVLRRFVNDMIYNVIPACLSTFSPQSTKEVDDLEKLSFL